jgi:acetoacetate decarboxylase
VIPAEEVRDRAFAMPLTSPSYPPGPYRYADRETLTITYRSDPAALRAALPEPLLLAGETARLQFIRMPDSTGFGDYALALQVIPCTLPDGTAAGYVHGAYVNAHTANSGGRELWGFPQKLARPQLAVARDTLLGTLDMGPVPVARASMGFKHRALDAAAAAAEIGGWTVLLKIIPHVDGRPRICELVRCRFAPTRVAGGWTGPAALSLSPHALAPLTALPVLEVLGATHVIADGVLGLGEVVHDYLAEGRTP